VITIAVVSGWKPSRSPALPAVLPALVTTGQRPGDGDQINISAPESGNLTEWSAASGSQVREKPGARPAPGHRWRRPAQARHPLSRNWNHRGEQRHQGPVRDRRHETGHRLRPGRRVRHRAGRRERHRRRPCRPAGQTSRSTPSRMLTWSGGSTGSRRRPPASSPSTPTRTPTPPTPRRPRSTSRCGSRS